MGEISVRHSTIGERGERIKLFPQEVSGPFQKYRRITAWVLMGLFAITPFLKFRGMPFIQFDVLERRLVLLGNFFWPQDIYRFVPFIIAFVILVFAVTALFGRIWCGWGCPQTVFPHFLFDPIERWLEGRAIKRKKYNEKQFTPIRFFKKALKWIIIASLLFLIVNLFFSYFISIDKVLQNLAGKEGPSLPYLGLTGICSLIGFMLFFWFREQACIMLCPYARFQSVLLDDNSIIIGYDEKRGEKRGNPHKLKQVDLGDCIDCRKCIRTCPTGIDIRDGLQLECIGCAKCIDACNSVMKAWNRPAGLVRYSSLNQFKTGTQQKFRPRIAGYGLLILVLITVSVVMVSSRPHTHVDVVRTTGKPYFLIGGDTVSNVVNLRIRNNQSFTQSYALLPKPGCLCAISQKLENLQVEGGKTLELPLNILMSASQFRQGKAEASFYLKARNKQVALEVGLLGPVS